MADLGEDDEYLEFDDYIQININNRNHIRNLSKILAPVDGFILTGALGLLYFILNSRQHVDVSISPLVIYLLLLTSVFMIGSIVSSIQSVTVKTQKPILTKIQYMDNLHDVYVDEYDWALLSVRLLISGIVAFIAAMISFSWNYRTT